jgi:hypothetical protein
MFWSKTSVQSVKEVFYKLLITMKGCSESFMLKNNARTFLEPIDFKKC